MVYGMALRAWHGICCGLVRMAWSMVFVLRAGMLYGMSCRAWHGIWYCLARYGMVYSYGVAWRAWHCKWYGLVGIAWYSIGMAWYMLLSGGLLHVMACRA